MQGSITDSGPLWGLLSTGNGPTNRGTLGTRDSIAAQYLPNNPDEGTATLIGATGAITKPSDLPELSDNQLMIAVARGSEGALEKLYDRHIQSCFGLAMKIVREPSVAEEVVQEVFIKVWSRPDAFSPGRGSFRSWLLTVVHNGAVDKLRRMRARATVSILPIHAESDSGGALIDMLPDSAPSPHEQAWAEEKGGMVRHALRQLPNTEYQAITLAYFEGLTQREIAEKLDQPLGTVKTRTRSALQRLR